jgi:hypothetical protein
MRKECAILVNSRTTKPHMQTGSHNMERVHIPTRPLCIPRSFTTPCHASPSRPCLHMSNLETRLASLTNPSPASLLSCNSLYHHVGSVGFFPRVLPSPSESSFDRALRSLPQQRKWDEKQRCTSPQSSILHTVCVPSPIRTSSHPLPEWVSPDTESWERSSGHLA